MHKLSAISINNFQLLTEVGEANCLPGVESEGLPTQLGRMANTCSAVGARHRFCGHNAWRSAYKAAARNAAFVDRLLLAKFGKEDECLDFRRFIRCLASQTLRIHLRKLMAIKWKTILKSALGQIMSNKN